MRSRAALFGGLVEVGFALSALAVTSWVMSLLQEGCTDPDWPGKTCCRGKMTRYFPLPVVWLALLVTILVAACGGSAPDPTPTPGPAPKPTPTPEPADRTVMADARVRTLGGDA